ncbi:hypothetical protein MRX96_032582 [Rhipicephalus microplus]
MVQTAFAQHLPESRSTLRDVTEGLLTLSADEWVKAINDAHNVTALKIQASDSVIDTNMASVRRVGEYLPAEGATWPLLASKVLGDKTSTPALERIFTGLQQAAKTPQALTWMDDKEREVASAIVSNTSLLVVSSTIPTVSKPDYTGPAGSLFQDDPDAFLLTYARARRHHYNVMLHSPPARTDLLMSDMEQGGQIAYLPLLKSLFVPTLPQRAPFLYAVGVPDRYNYGTVGGLLATKLIDVIVKNERTWNEVSKTKQAKVMACLFGKHNHLGARLAYAAMEADFRERVGGNEELAQKWWPDVQETFFMRFCLTWCSSIRAPVPLTYEEMCLLPLYNMKEFGARYGCKSNSTYSAGPMCDV